MKTIIPVASTIIGNEKAYGLFEINLQSPGNKGFHRYQIIQVNRGDVICEWRIDMGVARKFKGVNQLRIPSFWEHTVDELKGIADTLRGKSAIDVKDFLQLESYISA